jgi:hypothetical protein
VETYFVLLVFLLSILYPTREYKHVFFTAPLLTLLFFAFSNYLFIGYTIPFLGAIVRYRIIYEGLLLAVAAARIDWKRILPDNIYKKLL